MTKVNHAANDAQLKARRTSLGKKSKDELINIILRKDSTERKNNAKIQELQILLKEADELNEQTDTRILGFEKDMKGMEEIVKTKQEQIDALINEKNNLANQVEGWSKKYVNVKNISSLRRKVLFVEKLYLLVLVL